MGKQVTLTELIGIRKQLKREGKSVVFTNGCFDIIHRGHVEYLTKARALGDALFVGVNTDASVKRIKGQKRPIICQEDRAYVLAALQAVDYVCLFEEDTPQKLIESIVPDVLVKGSDWAIDSIVGREIVEEAGGKVQAIEFVSERSTTDIIKKIVEGGT
jgi:D-beta-D-heptose 7-phosphate kinase/D-beta-D-heptose 1-phosphate adenosyltransferase